MCFLDHFSLCNDFLRGLLTDVEAHGIVHVATRVDHLRVVTQLHGFVYQIIRIHADAVSSDKSWVEFQEIPFRSCRFEYIKGVDAHFTEVNNINKHIIRGSFNTGNTENPQIVIGAGIESATAIYIEKPIEKATLYLPNKKSTSFSNLNDAFNSYNVLATGTFMVQQEFDNKYIFTNIGFMKFMLDMQPDEYSAAEIKLSATSENETNTIVETISKILGSNYTIQTRYQQNQSLYTVMKMEKWIIYAILSLILIVAAFNMIGALTMLVLEKQKDIAVLKAIGANNTSIQNIFLSVGLLLATVGGASGILIATVICWSQQKFKILELGGGSFVVDYYPVKMDWLDFVMVISTIFIVAIAASFLPARKASRATFSLKS